MSYTSVSAVLISFTFLFIIYKMVDTIWNHKPTNVNIGTVMKNPEKSKFVPDEAKLNKCVTMQLKN